MVTTVWGLLASLLWGTADFFGGSLSRRLPVLTVTLLTQVIGLAGAVTVAAVTAATIRPTGYLAWGVAAGLVGPTALMAFYRALATGTMGVVAPIAALGTAVPVLAGLTAGERPSLPQSLGIAVAVVGVVLAGGPELRTGAPGRGRAVGLALVAAAGFGTVFVLIARGSETSVAMTLVTQRAVNVAFLTAVVVAARVVRGRPDRPRALIRPADLPLLVLIGLSDMAANGAYGLAANSGYLTVAAVLSSLYPVVTALLARQIHAERLRRVQLAGTAAAIGGIVLIAGG